jgi:uncharacterized protein YbjT (DUF2867 family)
MRRGRRNRARSRLLVLGPRAFGWPRPEERERRGATNFAEMATRENIGRVVYLGGLGDRPGSKHLHSRHRTAQIFAERGPPLTYFRAGMVVGAGSESYCTLRYLVQRLPAMIAPAWLATPTQPIGIDDVIAYPAKAPDVPASEGREVQIGGPDVLTYGESSTGWPRRWMCGTAPGFRSRCSRRGCPPSGSASSPRLTPPSLAR